MQAEHVTSKNTKLLHNLRKRWDPFCLIKAGSGARVTSGMLEINKMWALLICLTLVSADLISVLSDLNELYSSALELETAVKSLENCKSSGLDDFPSKFYTFLETGGPIPLIDVNLLIQTCSPKLETGFNCLALLKSNLFQIVLSDH